MERHRKHHSFKIDIKVGIKYVVFEPLTLIVCFNYAGISIQENSISATSCYHLWVKYQNFILHTQ